VAGCGGQLDGQFGGQQAIFGKETWLAATGCFNRHLTGNGGHFDGQFGGRFDGRSGVMGTLVQNTIPFFEQGRLNWEALWKIDSILHLCICVEVHSFLPLQKSA
jgi:hypothetical protein